MASWGPGVVREKQRRGLGRQKNPIAASGPFEAAAAALAGGLAPQIASEPKNDPFPAVEYSPQLAAGRFNSYRHFGIKIASTGRVW
jgi:hypothetical protein